MPKLIAPMSKAAVDKLTAKGFYAVGGISGLHLKVSKTGARSWIMRSVVNGNRRDIGLGSYALLPLDEAREQARQMLLSVKGGTDPVIERKQTKAAAAAARASLITFQTAAEQYIAANEAGWKNEKHGQQWTNTLKTYAYPTLGKLSVSDIETNHVIQCLEPIWTIKNETASRVRGRIESVLDWAKVRGYRSAENPARWKGHLDHILPAPSKVATVKNFAALPYAQVGAFMSALRKLEGNGARALELAILCAARSNEVRGMEWSEIDTDKKLWIIPAKKMKAKKEHWIPLPNAAIELLKKQPKEAGCDYVFPNAKKDILSDMTLTAVIRRMHVSSTKTGSTGWTDKGDIITAHGFRSTFRDWAGECTNHPREVIEHALAHQLKDKAEAAYARTTLLGKRAVLMNDWANFCDKAEPATVTFLHAVESVEAAA